MKINLLENIIRDIIIAVIKMKYENILFDLDGTLTNSALGITRSVKYALDFYNIEVTDLSELNKFIGPALIDSFMDYYKFPKEKAVQAVEKYRERFSKIGLYENEVYDGIPELLDCLKSNGANLIVATAKPTVFTELILEHFNLTKYFSIVCGSELDGSMNNKADIIRLALHKSNINVFDKTIMIGDRNYDIIGAKSNNLDSIGVLYGFGDREELENAGATYIAKNIEEIKSIVI